MEWKWATLTALLGVVALTIWAAAAPSILKSPWGLLVGAALTALATVAAGYVPGIPGAMRRRRAELARLEAEEAADQEALRRASELPGTSPAGLLDPGRGLVDFTGRDRELAALLAWCEDGQPRGVLLVTGPGGVGKTRLSVELCARLEPRGWRCVRVGDREEGVAPQVARRGWPGRVLLVVDYAETRIGLGDLLRAVAAGAGPVRVLLLARSAGEWWDRLGGAEPAVRDLLAGGGGEALPATVSRKLSNADLVSAAVTVFAAELGVAAPSRVLVQGGSGPIPMLDLHAAALVAVLRSAGAGGPVSVSVGDVLDELLGHEERFWQGTAEQAGLLAGTAGMTVAVLRQIVAAGALLGAASQDQAVGLLSRVPGAVASVKVASWLRDLYPPDEGLFPEGGTEWLGTLRPDRLAERLVVAQLSASQTLAEQCLTGLDERQALRAVTLLGRAVSDQQAAAGVLLERVLPLLEQVVAGLPADIELLTAISNAIPYPSPVLAEADLAVTRRIVALLPVGELELRARWLSWLSVTLAQTGRPAEALPVIQEAVEIRRKLAAADPDRHRANLAGSLTNLSIIFSELGRLAEALPVAQEAVDVHRELSAADPDRYRDGLATSLTGLGVRLAALGRRTEALPVTQEAVEIWRELAAAYPDRYRANLATSLTNLGVRFSALGRPAESLPAEQEAMEIWQELAAAYPDRYRANLAMTLSNLGVRFSALGRPAESLPAEQEAMEIWQELAAAYPDRYRANLAMTLSNLGVRFSEVGHSAESLPAEQEAVEIRRELAAAYPDRYRDDLARSLSNLGIALSALGRSAEALPVVQEAVEIRRELAAAYPDRYRADLADSLSILGGRFWELGRPIQALPVVQEAVEIRRELAAAYPDRYRADLADSLSNLGIALSALGRSAEALVAAQEAVNVYRELADAYPDRYRDDLATSLTNLGTQFVALDRSAEALPVVQEAVEIRRELAAAYPDRYRDGLAISLTNLGTQFVALDRSAEALPVVQEAVEIRRELAAAYPDRYRADLATSLTNLGTQFVALDRSAEALPVVQEAVEIRRELAAAYPDRYRADLTRSLSVLAFVLDGLGHKSEAEVARRDAGP